MAAVASWARRSVAWSVVVGCVVLALPVAAQDDTVTLNFVNADIESVVKAVSEITGRNFILDPKIKGTVNIISARPVPKSLVYPTLLSALRLQGVAAVEGNGVTKLVLEVDAKMHGSDVGRGGVGGGDRLTTQVITLRHESATQMVAVLRPLITPNNTIAAFPATNAIVITDYAENLRRLEKVIASLDQPPAGEPIVVRLRYASALDLVPLVQRLLGAEASTGAGAAPGAPGEAAQQRVTIVADPRSNSVMLRSENSARAARVKALFEELDTPGRPGGNMFIVYLKNAEAAKVAQTLRALMSGGADIAPAPTTPSAIGNQLGAATTGGSGSGLGGAAAPAAPPTSSNPFVAAAGGGALSGGLTIQADTATNALVIMGPEPLYNNLRTIIERLDVRRAQVFVEALIVEVAADKAAEFGIQWQFLQGLGRDGVQGFGGTNFGARDSGNNIIAGSVDITSLGQGLNAGIVNGTISLPGIGTLYNLAFLARALEQTTGANILSTPTLLTLDNEEARIIVGQNVPFVTGQYATTGSASTVQPFQTIERRDIGVMLRVKPQITEGGTIRLVVYQEVSRVESFSTTTGLVLSKRALESSVIVDDKQVAVLGGLIQDSFSDGSDRVPVLGDLPVLGSLFRYDQRKRQKVNLLIFLKPTVVRTDWQGKAITSERYDYIMNEQQRSRPEFRYFWQDQSVPSLPTEGAMPGTRAGETPSTVSPLPPADTPLLPGPITAGKPTPSPTAPGAAIPGLAPVQPSPGAPAPVQVPPSPTTGPVVAPPASAPIQESSPAPARGSTGPGGWTPGQ
ncbi:MAG: type II secretion system secretin GspD [Burkholderiales bacterium]|nr:type II secretion system secretin GspD [Burkholderiales bacterium]